MEKPNKSFIDYLLDEDIMDVNLDDPQQAMMDIRKAGRLSPDARNRQQAVKAKEERRTAQADKSPTGNLQALIARKKMELIQLQRRLATLTRADAGEIMQ